MVRNVDLFSFLEHSRFLSQEMCFIAPPASAEGLTKKKEFWLVHQKKFNFTKTNVMCECIVFFS